MMSEKQHM